MSETNTAPANSDPIVGYGDAFKIAISALPPASLLAMVSRGITHYMGSEQSSKVVAARKAAEEKGEAFTDEAAEALKNTSQKEAWQALLDGKVGMGNRGPRGTATETVMRRLIVADITAKLKAHKLSVPKGDATVTLGSRSFTLAQLIERAMAREGERFRREAEAEIKAMERKAAAAIAKAAQAGGEGPDALGL